MRSTASHGDPDPKDREPGADQAEAGGTGSPSRRRGAKRTKKGSFWRELPLLVVTALVLTFLIQTFLARVYVIPSQSMEQTLHGCPGCSDDRILVDKVTYDFHDPKPGDVVVFRSPDSWGGNPEFTSVQSSNFVVHWVQQAASLIGLAPPDERDLVKRVIAVGGQTVQCCDDQNRVTVDGRPLDEPYLFWEAGTGAADQKRFGPVTVPADHLWVMGDNRNDSADSRYHPGGPDNGSVPVDNVVGKARFVVLPVSRWQGVGDHDPQAQSLGAAGWQAGLPAGAGLAAAWPTVWAGRRLRRGLGKSDG